MIKERLEAVKAKIDRYAREAVQREVTSEVSKLVEEYLRPLAEDYLSRSLEAYLKKHLTSSLADAVSALEEVFDTPSEEPAVSYAEEPVRDVFGRDLDAVEDPSFLENDETFLKNRLLAFIQVYQVQENTQYAPKQKSIADHTGIKSMQIVRFYSDLRDEGRIEGPLRDKNKKSVIRILKPLENPERYL